MVTPSLLDQRDYERNACLQSASAVGLESSEMWRAAAHNMELTDPQKKALCQLRRLFMQKQEALIVHRHESTAALQRAIPNAASSHDIASQFLLVSCRPSKCNEFVAI